MFQIPSTISAKLFSHIAMDLITGLPKSEDYDAILTIVDHGCSRVAIFLPCSTSITGTSIAKLYLEHVFHWFGLPQKIISDRDPHFTSHFARELTKGLGIDQNLSTAFYPQTDGLSERTNQWVEQYLHLIAVNQNEWSRWLPMATTVHNNGRNSTTGFAPNELLIGWEPPLTVDQQSESKNYTAEGYLSSMRCNRLMAIHALNKVAYKTGTPTSTWKTGQLVWLEGKNLPLPYGTAKLAPRQHGPFKISKIISPVVVRLELLAQWSIHPVFHTSLLTPYTETPSHGPNFTQPPSDLIDGEEEYEVEQICPHWTWGWRKTLQYLIKWKGYPESNNTWENADQIHVPALIKLYHQMNTQKAIKARQTCLEQYPFPNLDPTRTPPCSLPYLPIILHDSTAALVWSTTHEDNIRLACSLHAPPAQYPLAPWVHTMPPTSCVTLTVSKSTLQTSTTSRDNLLYILRPLAPTSLTQCLLVPPSTHQTNHLIRPHSHYPHVAVTHQP
jgi:Chromo (CHRromatin Organisation MOdifier) domain